MDEDLTNKLESLRHLKRIREAAAAIRTITNTLPLGDSRETANKLDRCAFEMDRVKQILETVEDK
jgi:hypothetical protein